MAFFTFTNTISNGISADGDNLQTNFNDVRNSLIDATKDISVLKGTFAGTITGTSTLAITGAAALSSTLSVAGSAIGIQGVESTLGFTLAAGVFTITRWDATTLSTTIKGQVWMPSTTAGVNVLLSATTPASFNDDTHASSSLTNFGAGITETANWANDMPWFIYAINRGNSDFDGVDGSSMFCITRNPAMASSPSAAGNIGDTSAIPSTDDQTSIMILANVTVANYTSLPCKLIGAFRMRWSTTTDDWTVQALGDNDGIGEFYLDKAFSTSWTMPQNQNGAAASSFLFTNGGTIPVFTTQNYSYCIGRDGWVDLWLSLTGDGGTNGSGAVDTQLSLPSDGTMVHDRFNSSMYLQFPTSSQIANATLTNNGTNDLLVFRAPTVSGTALQSTVTNVDLSAFSNGNRTIEGQFKYKAY